MFKKIPESSAGILPRKHAPDRAILIFVGLLMLLGLIIMYAIGPQRANVLNSIYNTDYYTSMYFVVKQMVSLIAALVVFIIFSYTPFRFIQKISKAIFITALLACVLLFIFGNVLHVEAIAQCSLGACRWFNLGSFGGFQPAELLKFGALLVISGFMAARIRERKVNNVQESILPLAIVTALIMFFVIIIQKDMGTGAALMSIIIAMGVSAGISKKIGAVLLVAILAVGAVLIVIAPHRLDRLGTFFRGDSVSSSTDASDYHIRHAKIAIGTGGLFGVGIGNSVQATGYLPEAINDSVFAIMAEIFGFIGVCAILGLFTALMLRLLAISDKLQDPWMKLIVAGVFGWLAAHVLLNIGSMIGILPLTGITLPLLSFGGTSMLFIAAALGLAFQLSRYTRYNTEGKDGYEGISSRRGIRGARYSGRRSRS